MFVISVCFTDLVSKYNPQVVCCCYICFSISTTTTPSTKFTWRDDISCAIYTPIGKKGLMVCTNETNKVEIIVKLWLLKSEFWLNYLSPDFEADHKTMTHGSLSIPLENRNYRHYIYSWHLSPIPNCQKQKFILYKITDELDSTCM